MIRQTNSNSSIHRGTNRPNDFSENRLSSRGGGGGERVTLQCLENSASKHEQRFFVRRLSILAHPCDLHSRFLLFSWIVTGGERGKQSHCGIVEKCI